MTALHWAAMNGDLELAEMLIVAGANVRATTRLGTYTPLYLASQQGHGADDPGADHGRRRSQDRHAQRHHAVDGGRRRRRSGRGQSADREWRRRERERRRSRADAADVCRGLESRRRDRAARGQRRRSQGDEQGLEPRQPVARRPRLWRQSAGAWRRRRRRAGGPPRADARRRPQLLAQRVDRRARRPDAAALCGAPGLPRIHRRRC